MIGDFPISRLSRACREIRKLPDVCFRFEAFINDRRDFYLWGGGGGEGEGGKWIETIINKRIGNELKLSRALCK